MNNPEQQDNPPMFDWDRLVDKARSDGPSELYHCLKQYMAYRSQFKASDYPQVVLDYLRESLSPTGKRGRPKTSEWSRIVYRDSFEIKRLLFEVTKKTGGKVVDRNGNELPVDGTPSDMAIAEVAKSMFRSEGAALDVIYPKRKTNQRAKKR